MADLNCYFCGACCVVHGDANHRVALYGDDKNRLSGEEKYWIVDVTDYLRSIGCFIRKGKVEGLKTKINDEGLRVCIALNGVVGKNARCSIYKIRPKHCVNLKPDLVRCNKFRKWANLPMF